MYTGRPVQAQGGVQGDEQGAGGSAVLQGSGTEILTGNLKSNLKVKRIRLRKNGIIPDGLVQTRISSFISIFYKSGWGDLWRGK